MAANVTIAQALAGGGVLDQIPTRNSGTLSWSQLSQLAQRAGLNAAQANIAAAVAIAESGGRPLAHNPNGCDDSYGLWQINMVSGRAGCDNLGPGRRAQYGIASNDALYDPLQNARAMVAVSGGGNNWRPWTMFTNGTYAKYLNGAASPAAGAGAGPGGASSSGDGTDATQISADANPCLIGEITLPGALPNIPCFFYKSWGYAIIGGLALTAGGIVMLVGALVIAGNTGTVRSLASLAGKGPGAVSASAETRARRRATALDQAGKLEGDRRSLDEERFLLAQQAEVAGADRADTARRARAARTRVYNLPRGNQRGRVGFDDDDEEPF